MPTWFLVSTWNNASRSSGEASELRRMPVRFSAMPTDSPTSFSKSFIHWAAGAEFRKNPAPSAIEQAPT